MSIKIVPGDCLEVMPSMEANSVDAVVTDPPAGISFMGKIWDHDKGGRDQWIAWMQTVAAECLRVLKPGGHALVWALPRTSHWTATAWENAGFTVRDRVIHIFGSGFPKSLDVSKAIDKAEDYKLQSAVRRAAVSAVEAAGLELPGNSRHDWTVAEHAPGAKWWAEFERWLPGLADVQRERIEGEIVAQVRKGAGWFTNRDIYDVRAPATDAARQWQGWGTALKPAAEDFWLLRKPFPKGYTVAQNVLEFGVGGLNIDGCRVNVDSDDPNHRVPSQGNAGANSMFGVGGHNGNLQVLGRWPANVTHDGSDEVLAAFPETTSGSWQGQTPNNSESMWAPGNGGGMKAQPIHWQGDTGSAARFFHNTREGESRVFYTAKASSFDRNDGCYDLPSNPSYMVENGSKTSSLEGVRYERTTTTRNHHPCVKPTELMRWLCRLITPPGGTILDPFCGSGSTLKAAEIEGFSAIGIECDPAYVEIARRRIASDIPLFAEIAALTEEALSNSASETLWCSPYCVPERVLQFDLFLEDRRMNTPTLRVSCEDTRPLAGNRLRGICA